MAAAVPETRLEYRGPIRKKPSLVGAPANTPIPLSRMLPRATKPFRSKFAPNPQAVVRQFKPEA